MESFASLAQRSLGVDTSNSKISGTEVLAQRFENRQELIRLTKEQFLRPRMKSPDEDCSEIDSFNGEDVIQIYEENRY